jgi:transposase, IS5 family
MAKQKRVRGFFDEHFRLEKIKKQKDPLIRLNECIKWEQFRSILDVIFTKENKGKGGRPPFDYLMMFKIIILQRYYNLSDDQTEFQILDRLSFSRFLGLELHDIVPDSKTIWLFKETLIANDAIESLFNLFGTSLANAGLVANEGKIVDASFVDVPRQRNSRAENKMIKEGETPEEWKSLPNKLSQKDVDARWTKKNNELHYGYKNHIKVDLKSKIIDNYVVTEASVHDSQEIKNIIGEEDSQQPLYADSAYSGQEIKNELVMKNIENQIHEKGVKNKPLTEEQQKSNNEKSKFRVRVEHIFGFVENSMNGSHIKTIGIKRAKAVIGLMNLTYNMFRSIQILKIRGIAMSI